MEHRCGKRIELVIPVEVGINKNSRGYHLSSNISYGGLLLNFTGELNTTDLLTVKIPNLISSPGSDSAYRHQLKALVIHKSENHLGVMWADYNIPFFNQLELLLSGASAISQASKILAS